MRRSLVASAGLGLGFVLGCTLTLLWSATFADAELADGGAELPEARDAALDEMRRDNAALRAQLEQVAASGARQAAAPVVAPTAARAAAPLAHDEAVVLDRLLAVLAEQQHAGLLRQHFADQLGSLVRLVVDVWMSAGTPQPAMQLLAQLGQGLFEVETVVAMAEAALAQGDRAGALEAYLAGLQISPDSAAVVRGLCALDAAGGLLALDRLLLERQDETRLREQLESHRLALLLAAHRTDEAKLLLDRLIAEERMAPDEESDTQLDLWDVAVRYEPAMALERLRRQLEGVPADERVDLRLQVARALRFGGDPTAARRELDKLLTAAPDSYDLVTELAELDRPAAIAFAKARVTAAPTHGAFNVLASLHEKAGNADLACAAYWESWRLDMDSEVHERLLALAPQRFIEPILNAARESLAGQDTDYGEILGDVAKAAWRTGDRSRAIALWREAQRRDPEDSEWPGRLRAALAGRDPLR